MGLAVGSENIGARKRIEADDGGLIEPSTGFKPVWLCGDLADRYPQRKKTHGRYLPCLASSYLPNYRMKQQRTWKERREKADRYLTVHGGVRQKVQVASTILASEHGRIITHQGIVGSESATALGALAIKSMHLISWAPSCSRSGGALASCQVARWSWKVSPLMLITELVLRTASRVPLLRLSLFMYCTAVIQGRDWLTAQLSRCNDRCDSSEKRRPLRRLNWLPSNAI